MYRSEPEFGNLYDFVLRGSRWGFPYYRFNINSDNAMKCEWMLGKQMLRIRCVYRYTGFGAGANGVWCIYRCAGPGADANRVFHVCTGSRKPALNSSPLYCDTALRDGEMRDGITDVSIPTIYTYLRFHTETVPYLLHFSPHPKIHWRIPVYYIMSAFCHRYGDEARKGVQHITPKSSKASTYTRVTSHVVGRSLYAVLLYYDRIARNGEPDTAMRETSVAFNQTEVTGSGALVHLRQYNKQRLQQHRNRKTKDH